MLISFDLQLSSHFQLSSKLAWPHCVQLYFVLFFRVEQRSPTIYLGGGQDFLSEIGLFRKLPGTELFASRVKSGSSIELGENVQLRSIVRSGDGKIIYSFHFFKILHPVKILQRTFALLKTLKIKLLYPKRSRGSSFQKCECPLESVDMVSTLV